MNLKYKHAILGGTFDYLHAGHKRFINAACENAENVTIGITTKGLLEQKIHKQAIQSYAVREKSLKDYLRAQNWFNKVSIIPLVDIVGAGFDKDLDAIYAIDESYENAKLINKGRIKRKLSPAKIIIVPMLYADDGELISSKRIRGGEIDRDGRAYLKLFGNTLHIEENLKPQLRKPFGKIIKDIDDYKKMQDSNSFVIAVGDIVVSNLIKIGSPANVSIFDLKTNRQHITDNDVLRFLPRPNITVTNKPSTIEKGAVSVFNSILRKSAVSNKKYCIRVDGEEDLLAIPAILLAPLGAIVLYGMRDIGGIAVEVTEEKKGEVKRILHRFDILNLK